MDANSNMTIESLVTTTGRVDPTTFIFGSEAAVEPARHSHRERYTTQLVAMWLHQFRSAEQNTLGMNPTH